MEITASVEVQHKTPDPSPRKTKLTGDTSPSPSKQRKQKQNLKLKLESLMLKEPELTRRRPVRMASRKSFYSDSLIILVSQEGLHCKILQIFGPNFPKTSGRQFTPCTGLYVQCSSEELKAGIRE